MTFHSDFWVAATTAAPVIALAAIVSSGDPFRHARKIISIDLQNRDYLRYRGLARLINLLQFANLTNIAMQGITLWFSLQSLETGNNEAAPILIIWFTIAGLALLIWASLLSGRVTVLASLPEVNQVGEENSKQEASTRRGADTNGENAEDGEESS
jgi:hypothetical protein